MCNVLILHKNDSILDTYGSVHRSVCACVVDDPNRTRLRPVAFDHLRLGGSLNDRKVVARLGFLNVAYRTEPDAGEAGSRARCLRLACVTRRVSFSNL